MMVMMMMKTEMAAVFVNTLLLLCCCFITSTVSQEDVYAAAGEEITLRLKNKLDSSQRLYWKHNGIQIASIRSGVVLGDNKRVGTDGSLTLRDLKKGSVEVYTSEIYKGGHQISENTFIVHVLDRVQKPTLVATCENNTETFKCQVPQAEGLTIAWLQDEKPLNETSPTLTRDPKQLTAESSFKCKVSNHISSEISQPVKKTCPVPDKVQKPTLVATCEKNTEIFKCQVPQAEGLTITWLQDEKPMKETGSTLKRDPKQLTAESSFKCNVSNLASFEISQPVKKTCPVPEQPATKLLFGFDFWTMVGILAGGGGFVLLLIIITIVLCTRARRRRHNRLKAEGRGELEMAWSNQQQQQQQQQYQPARHGDPGLKAS